MSSEAGERYCSKAWPLPLEANKSLSFSLRYPLLLYGLITATSCQNGTDILRFNQGTADAGALSPLVCILLIDFLNLAVFRLLLLSGRHPAVES